MEVGPERSSRPAVARHRARAARRAVCSSSASSCARVGSPPPRPGRDRTASDPPGHATAGPEAARGQGDRDLEHVIERLRNVDRGATLRRSRITTGTSAMLQPHRARWGHSPYKGPKLTESCLSDADPPPGSPYLEARRTSPEPNTRRTKWLSRKFRSPAGGSGGRAGAPSRRPDTLRQGPVPWRTEPSSRTVRQTGGYQPGASSAVGREARGGRESCA